jgi:uroporphyrinogen-III synthase
MSATTRIWVTRDEGPDGPLCSVLSAAGLEPVCEPVIERCVVADPGPHVRNLRADDWLVLTSTYAIEQMPPVGCRVAVVGESSARAARARGLRVELVAEGTGASLWRDLEAMLAGGERICFPMSSLGAEPPGHLEVDSFVLYRTEARTFDAARVAGVQAAAVCSPSAARVVGAMERPPRCASIGPTTSVALRQLGIEPWVEPPRATFEAMAEIIARTMNAER